MLDAAEAWLWLARAPGLHAATFDAAWRRYAGPGAVLSAPPEPGTADAAAAALCGLPEFELLTLGLPPAAAAHLAMPDAARLGADRDWLERNDWRLLGYRDPAYPLRLAQIADPPVALYVRGSIASLSTRQLALVGSRHPTAAGRRNAQDFAAYFACAGLTVTSGLAIGIDAAAHEAALAAGGCSLAVLGHGPDTLYPRANEALARRLLDARGALLSEFPPGTPPLPGHFPRRNRLISGLSLGTVVIEAARQSGSLITARAAAAQGREVYVLPGSIHNLLSRGCHELIREGATLVESAAEVCALLNILSPEQALTAGVAHRPPGVAGSLQLDKDYEILLDAVGFEPTNLDSLVDQTGLPSPSVASMLLILELEGKVGLHPGGRYVRLS